MAPAFALAPETQEALELISDIYRIEREASEAGISGTDAHLALCKQKSLEVVPAVRAAVALGTSASRPIQR